MISIYNETKTPWIMKVINEKVVGFSKAIEFKKPERTVRKSVHIIGYNTLFGEQNVPEALDDLVEMTYVSTLTAKDTTIIFSKKDYNPFITERSQQLKDILLVSLELKGRKVLSVSDENTFLLDGYILGGELTVITSLNNFEHSLNIKLLDEMQSKVVVYSFYRNENKVMSLDVTESPATEEDKAVEFKLKKFRPSRPTHTVLVYKKDLEQLQQVIDTTLYNVVELSKQTLDQVIEQLKEQNYKAVTLFINTDEITGVTKKIYGAAMINLSKNFKTYYELLSNGRTRKVKIS